MTEAEQLPLLPGRTARPRRSRVSSSVPISSHAPVAQVVIDSPVPHLDRVFDYAVPASLDDSAVVGARVRVRFAGRLTNAFIVGRVDEGEREGELKPLERVVGVEPVLTAQTLPLVQDVAERYAGTVSDVLRSAVPPRHARAETTTVEPAAWSADPTSLDSDRWSAYDSGPALVGRLGAERPRGTRAVWSAAPATSWSADLAALARCVLVRPRGGVLVVVPDAADVERVVGEFEDAREAGVLATLTADQGPERRYREFVRVLRGGARLVVGTRASVFAPVADLSLLLVWDDGNDALVDHQAPYWDARDVAALRSHLSGCDLVVGSPARSVVTQQWCQSGWARSVQASRATVTDRGPSVRALSSDDLARDEAAAAARLPHRAWEAARAALREGPVLVQVARRGYLPTLACQRCRAVARCSCGGPLSLPSARAVPRCTWCGAMAGDWTCAECGSDRLRAVSVGAERTAEEIGRAFPDTPVVSSHAGRMTPRVPDEPALVVATPGAEPECDPGYRAVLILDARAQLHRPAIDAEEDAARRWFAAARLAVPRAPIVVTADNALPVVQALMRWDAPWLAARELADRASAGLPPVTRMAVLSGASSDIAEVEAALTVPHRLLGPVPDPDRNAPDRERAMIVVAREHAAELAQDLRAITATRSAHARSRPVHVRMDPRDI
jgi:primosomal protein N' (replication factor Y)